MFTREYSNKEARQRKKRVWGLEEAMAYGNFGRLREVKD